jgi:hypothetical protein
VYITEEELEFYNKVIEKLENRRRYLKRDKRAVLLSIARDRSRLLGFSCDLETTDIQIPEKCPYLGIPLTDGRLDGKQKSSMSIDRIDPTKGYVKGNVQIISWLANRMKTDATVEELVKFAQGVLTLHE